MSEFSRKQKLKVVALFLFVLSLVALIGCGGSGGGSGSNSTTPNNPSGPAIFSVQLGLPISSIDGTGTVDGPLFNGNLGEIVVCVDSNNLSGHMSVWMQVNSQGADFTHYDWEIVDWQNHEPFGSLSSCDQEIDIDDSLGVYKVRSYDNKVCYDSTTNSMLSSDHVEEIKVTAWTEGGHFVSAYFTLILIPFDENYDPGDDLASSLMIGVNGIKVSDEISSDADIDVFRFYAIEGESYTIAVEGEIDTDTLFLSEVQTNLFHLSDTGGDDVSSLVDWVCPETGMYYLVPTSSDALSSGSYNLSVCSVPYDLQSEVVELFILGGQSNMEANPGGWGDLPVSLQFDQDNTFYWPYVRQHALYENNVAVHPANSVGWGPEIVMANELRRTHYKVAFAKAAWGGTGLDDWLGTGDRFPYTQLINKITTAISDLESMGYTVKVNSLTWMQGETDAITQELGTSYYDNFLALIENIKADCNLDELEVNLCRISGSASSVINRPYYSDVSNAQTDLATYNSWINLISTDGLTLKDDNLHFDASGVIGLSLRILDSIESSLIP